MVFSHLKCPVIISTMSEVDDIIMMTGNFTCENTISESLPFSTFNYCHRYTSVKTTVFKKN